MGPLLGQPFGQFVDRLAGSLRLMLPGRISPDTGVIRFRRVRHLSRIRAVGGGAARRCGIGDLEDRARFRRAGTGRIETGLDQRAGPAVEHPVFDRRRRRPVGVDIGGDERLEELDEDARPGA